MEHVLNRVSSNEKTKNEKFLILDNIIFQNENVVQNLKAIVMEEKKNIFNKKEKSNEVEKLKSLFSKKKCFILGNGPSLNDIDLSLLKNEFVIGSNYILNGFSEINCNFIPTILGSGDSTCVSKIINDDNIHLINENTVVVFHPTNAKFMEEDKECQDKIYSNLKKINYKFIKRFDDFWIDDKFMKKMDFKINVEKYCFYYRNVVAMINMLIAEKLGFKEIYLLGCDMNKFTTHFYKYKSHTRVDRGPKFDYSILGYELVYKAFNMRKNEFDKKNIKVYNCTLTSSLDMFEKIHISNVLLKDESSNREEKSESSNMEEKSESSNIKKKDAS